MTQIKLPDCGMFIGSAVLLDRADYLFQTSGKYYSKWVSEDHDPAWYIEKTIADNQGNLVVIWDGGVTKRCLRAMADWMDLEGIGYQVPAPDWQHGKFLTPEDWSVIAENKERFGAGYLRLVKKASELGLYSYGMYADANPIWVEKITDFENFLGYNTGEKFSFRLEEFPAALNPQGYSLQIVAKNFCNSVREFIDARKAEGWKNFLTTSASFHLDVEIAAAEGRIIPHVEGFAFCNLNFANSLCRGVQKQFAIPLWGLYIAHEHYAFLPYKSSYRFKMLDASMYLAYMSGSKLLTLESGNWWQQTKHVEDAPMHDTPKIDLGSIYNADAHKSAHLVEDVRKHYKKLGYDSSICKKYRKALSDFYDFVKNNGTPDGQPEITLAAVKGNMDLCSQYFHPNYAVAGAYKLAEQNPMWLEGMPERGWEIFRNVFFPLRNILGKYVNKFLSGTPYGMTDIVSFAGVLNSDFLAANYKALVFTGWNTASDQQYEILKEYVRSGGTLFISIPHLSGNVTRNYLSYSVDELVNHGDFSELCGVKVKKRGRQIYWVLPTENNPMGLSPLRQFGIMATHLGNIDICDDTEILAVEDEDFEPVLLLHRYGKGRVFFLNSWEYPGAWDRNEAPGAEIGAKGFIGEIYKQIAVEARGTVFITDDQRRPGNHCEHIVYSYFPSNQKIYLMNVDFTRSHKFFLHAKNKVEEIVLKPGEFMIR